MTSKGSKIHLTLMASFLLLGRQWVPETGKYAKLKVLCGTNRPDSSGNDIFGVNCSDLDDKEVMSFKNFSAALSFANAADLLPVQRLLCRCWGAVRQEVL